LHRCLGSGAFGTVWLARDQHLDRDVAVKIVPRERIASGRFEREARAAARLAHPGIVTLYEAAVDDEGAYLVSELVVGATLGALLGAGRLSDRQVVTIGIGLCDALAHAHAHGVVHRDVKPSNVLVPERPATVTQIAKLTDFGVARIIGSESLTRTGDVVGTAAYMAPEQAEGLPAGAPADLYSLALVLYESLTGVNPVAAESGGGGRRLGAYLPPLRRQRRDLPRELGQAIDLALRPRARERGTLEELRASLRSAGDLLEDRPGVVSAPFARSTPKVERDDAAGRTAAPDEVLSAGGAPRVRWQERAAAAASAALLAWLTGHLLAHRPLAPLAAALAAALLVAALPRIGWVTLAGAATAVLALQARPGAALLVLIAALIPIAALPRTPTAWPLCGVAAALGPVALGGAWPAVAARASTAWRRASLGAIGWIWLAIGSLLAGADLYLRRPADVPPASVWMSSLYETTHHVLAPLVTSGVLAGAPVWGVGAIVLPWITRRRSSRGVLVLVPLWVVGLAVATTAVLDFAAPGLAPATGTAVLGALGGALVALTPTLLSDRQRGRYSPARESDYLGERTAGLA
jgi:hypothetical protein